MNIILKGLKWELTTSYASELGHENNTRSDYCTISFDPGFFLAESTSVVKPMTS